MYVLCIILCSSSLSVEDNFGDFFQVTPLLVIFSQVSILEHSILAPTCRCILLYYIIHHHHRCYNSLPSLDHLQKFLLTVPFQCNHSPITYSKHPGITFHIISTLQLLPASSFLFYRLVALSKLSSIFHPILIV